jgi:quercetin dioxygenase-like cupin family protein
MLAVPFLACSLLLAACGGDGGDKLDPADGVTSVTRQILQSGAPSVAAGHDLILSRVVVPGGEELAAHTHPGVQLAVIVEGTLTYTIISGEVRVSHNSGTPEQRSETVGAGRTVELRPGSTVAETPGMVHRARNAGDHPVVIYLSSLFPTGAPPSSPAP